MTGSPLGPTRPPCTIVRYYYGLQHKVLELRVKEKPDVVASTIEERLWGVRRESSQVQRWRDKHSETLKPYTDEEIAESLHKTYHAFEDLDEFVEEAMQDGFLRR